MLTNSAAKLNLHCCQQMTMTITPQFIQQVFAEKPHVHRAFVENVPQKLDEKEFWTRFAKHEIQIQVSF